MIRQEGRSVVPAGGGGINKRKSKGPAEGGDL